MIKKIQTKKTVFLESQVAKNVHQTSWTLIKISLNVDYKYALLYSYDNNFVFIIFDLLAFDSIFTWKYIKI